MEASVRRGYSSARDAADAAREFHQAVFQENLALVLFFCSSDYDLDALGAELNRLFAGVPLIGCTTAGEIGPLGCRERGLSGVSFPSAHFAAAADRIPGLHAFDLAQGQALCRRLSDRLEAMTPSAAPDNTFALLLIDGLSVREECVARALQHALGPVPLAGGSAADGLEFGQTHVFADGQFQSDSAALVLVTTTLPFTIFKTQHFVATDQRVVITEADAAHRTVREIDGFPAATEYARLLDTEVGRLTPERFAASPMVVLIDGNNYVRSVQKANADLSLTFYCAIEEGVVLRIGRPVDIVENLQQAFRQIHAAIGPPALTLTFECLLRRLEVLQNGLEGQVSKIYRDQQAVGFHTYGEQFRGIHMNQTLTGVAIGASPREAPRA